MFIESAKRGAKDLLPTTHGMAEYLATRLKCVGIRAVGALLRRRNFICKPKIHKSLMQARPFTVGDTLK